VSSSPTTGSEASVDDIVVYNETNEKRHVELVVTPIDDSSNRFTDEFTLGPYAKDSYTDSKTIPDVELMDEECRVEVTVDGERSATFDWEGDVKDYTGLQIYVDYEEISFTRKVA
jgi:5-formaminoimidazole-4-carboxamide-1-beta-D-ribofuranosyl 5'-monophosphate synthetase